MSISLPKVAMSAIVASMAFQLSGCGEGSNNLGDPVSDGSTSALTTCDTTGLLSCTSGLFIDEPVVGLNYECGTVKNVTDGEGFFTCPDSTMVSFYLQGSTSERRINIGKYRIKATAVSTAKGQIQITPRDLLSYTAETIESGLPGGIQVTNILRLLQALDSDGYINENVSLNRIKIADADKDKLSVLTDNIEVSAFASNEGLEKSLAPFLTAVNKALPSAADAIARFNKTLPVVHGGVYEVFPFAAVTADVTDYTGMVGLPTVPNDHKLLESILMIVDRDGKSVGLNLEWEGTPSNADLKSAAVSEPPKFIVEKTPTAHLQASDDFGFNPSGAVKSGFKFLDQNGGSVEITQGMMEKGSMSGAKFFYRNIHGLTELDEVADEKLGKWRRLDQHGNVTFTGAVNMNRTRVLSPYLDPAVWRIEENTIQGEAPIFPLHLRLTLQDSRDTCGGAICTVGEMGITILANGNIISDRNNNCNKKLNADLTDEEGVQEHRLGTVAATIIEENKHFISPVILVGKWANLLNSDDPWYQFYGVQIGFTSFAGGPKVKINVSNAVNKQLSILDNQTANSVDGATWVNYVKFFNSIQKTNPTDTKQFAGAISKIAPQTCYTPTPKA